MGYTNSDVRSEPSGDQTDNNRANADRADSQIRGGSAPDAIISRLKSNLPKLHKGGTVPADGAYNLQAGEQVTPAPATQADASTQGAPDGQTDSGMSDNENVVAGEGVNLKRAFSKLNSAITALFDGLGIRRSSTISHVAGETMASHIETVGNALLTVGGLHANLLIATHTKHSATGGETIAYSADKLKAAIIPSKSEDAIKAIQSCRNFVNSVAKLIGDDEPVVRVAKSQLALIGKADMAGMSAFDAGAALLSIPGPLIQLIAQRHNFIKHGEHVIHLTGPKA
jgi:hypothetical protein